jgi:fructose-specific component phosphotransferase system IIB-like protein
MPLLHLTEAESVENQGVATGKCCFLTGMEKACEEPENLL